MTSATPTVEPLTVEVEHKPASQVTLRVEAPAAELEGAVGEALRRFSRQLRVPGFRPGKAPTAMVERVMGWEAVKQEAIEQLLPKLYARALDQLELQPVGDPEVDLGTVERHQPVTFTATVTVKPEVDLGDYLADFRVAFEATEVGEEDVDKTLEEVRRQHAEQEKVDRPAQSGDVLRAHLLIRRGDDTVNDQEGELSLERERLLPGLADALIGMPAGEERDFELTLPEDFSQETLRGATVNCHVRIEEVRERILPPLDDSLAGLDGHGETLEGLREHYRARLTEAAARQDDERYEQAVLEAFTERARVDIPEVMIDSQIDGQLRELEARLSQMGLSVEAYLQYSNSSPEKLRGESREGAIQQLKTSLGLDALYKAEGLEIDEAAVEREQVRMAQGQKVSRDQSRQLHRAAHLQLERQAAVARLTEIARGDA